VKLPFTLRDRPTQANFDKLAGALDFNHVKVLRVTFVWPGGTPLATPQTVAHGLGATPTAVVFGANSAGLGAHIPFCYANPSATSIFVQSRMADGSSPAAASTGVAWVAVFA
jgi:hypothetical protein